MMASMKRHTSLGEAASALVAATFPDVDWEIASHGDCTELLVRDQAKRYDEVAQRYGFRNRHHLLSVIAKRTSDRWVFFHFPIAR